MYEGPSVRLTYDFSSETLENEREWNDTRKDCQPRIYALQKAKLPVKTERNKDVYR